MNSVLFTFKVSEILYDVSNYSYVEGDILSEAEEHLRHQVMDVCESGNIDRVKRVLDLVHSECVEMLYPYSKKSLENFSDVYSNELNNKECYYIELQFPIGFSQTTIEYLRNLIHEYMVCRVVGDWMSITNTRSESKWEAKATIIRNKISISLLSRTGKIRRKLSPF